MAGPQGPEPGGVPVRVHRYVVALGLAALAAAAAVALGNPVVPRTSGEVVVAVAMLGALAVAGTYPLELQTREGGHHLVTLEEAVLVAMLVGLPLGLVPWLGLVVTLTDAVVRRRPAIKATYNGAASLLATSLACMVVAAVTPDDPSALAVLLPAVAAGAVSNGTELVLVAELFRRLDGTPVRTTLRGFGYAAAAMGVNLLAGAALGGSILADPWLAWIALALVAVVGIGQRDRAARAVESTQLRDIVTATSDGIALLAPDGTVVRFSPGMEAITGISAEDAVGRPFVETVAVRAVSDEPVDVPAMLVADHHAELDLDVQRDGQWRHCRVAVSPVHGTTGHLDGTVLVARDRTAEAEISQLKADFVAVVSHELRTPLTPLKGFVSTLAGRADQVEPAQVATIAQAMGRQVERLDALVSDLLMVADLDRGAGLADATEVDLLDVVRRAVAAEVPSHAPDLLRGPSSCRLATDPEGLGRVLRALLSNAVKHGGGPTGIEVEVGTEDVTIRVLDDGPGIPAAQREAVFDSFRRVGTHLEWSTQGPGLGLTIARGLTVRLGGQLELLPTSSGAAFELRLPLHLG